MTPGQDLPSYRQAFFNGQSSPVRKPHYIKKSNSASIFLRSVPSKGSCILQPNTEDEPFEDRTMKVDQLTLALRRGGSMKSMSFKTCEKFYQSVKSQLQSIEGKENREENLREEARPPDAVYELRRSPHEQRIERSLPVERVRGLRVTFACSHHELPISFVIQNKARSLELIVQFDGGRSEKNFGCVSKGRISPVDAHANFRKIDFVFKSSFDETIRLLLIFPPHAPTLTRAPEQRRKVFRSEDFLQMLSQKFSALTS